ncbi:MAG: hypothetical protein JSV03_04145, partial [Planctomycetota bacterium]
MSDQFSQPAVKQNPTLKRRVLLWIVVGGLLIVIGVGVKIGRHHVLPKRFAIVEAGQLYRSGHLETWPLQRVIRDHELKTVLALMNNEPDTA